MLAGNREDYKLNNVFTNIKLSYILVGKSIITIFYLCLLQYLTNYVNL